MDSTKKVKVNWKNAAKGKLCQGEQKWVRGTGNEIEVTSGYLFFISLYFNSLLPIYFWLSGKNKEKIPTTYVLLILKVIVANALQGTPMHNTKEKADILEMGVLMFQAYMKIIFPRFELKFS